MKAFCVIRIAVTCLLWPVLYQLSNKINYFSNNALKVKWIDYFWFVTKFSSKDLLWYVTARTYTLWIAHKYAHQSRLNFIFGVNVNLPISEKKDSYIFINIHVHFVTIIKSSDFMDKWDFKQQIFYSNCTLWLEAFLNSDYCKLTGV